ncbi:MAG: S-methyl-5-thioribose-1-phosphate isomerase [Planctomycetota bacterium]
MIETLSWIGDRDGHVHLIDQTQLPQRYAERRVEDPDAMIAAIQCLAVRGAPAIGVAGAYAICLATRRVESREDVLGILTEVFPRVRGARPTAVNLGHMVDRMARVVALAPPGTGTELRDQLLREARAIHEEDRELCRRIGAAGAPLIRDGMTVLTHCNAGALATGGMGTALSVLYCAQRDGVRFSVIADETRPLLQGARLTAWELERAGVPVTLICDNAAAHFFGRGEIHLVITGADRVAANGDSANKIGTYGVACLAARHRVPFYIAAPSTTFDFGTASGDGIPIEERSPDEVWPPTALGPRPDGIRVRNPAFDVTPHDLIAGWITEFGIVHPPFTALRA